MKQVTLQDFLTDTEINRCVQLWKEHSGARRKTFVDAVMTEIISPNMDRINKSLGQENDPRFLAYAIEYVMGQASK